jgi:catechol 2,3-dioxygenase-like lactoylglutathione lyase family enzyme
MVPQRLSVVTLGVRNVAELRRFYQGLGWEPTPESGDDWTAFLLGGTILALYPMALLGDEAAPSDAVPGPDAWSGVTLAVNVDRPGDVDHAFAEAVAAGATRIAEPVDRPWGGRSGYVADPEGNRWEIAWAPNAEFDARGAVTRFWP